MLTLRAVFWQHHKINHEKGTGIISVEVKNVRCISTETPCIILLMIILHDRVSSLVCERGVHHVKITLALRCERLWASRKPWVKTDVEQGWPLIVQLFIIQSPVQFSIATLGGVAINWRERRRAFSRGPMSSTSGQHAVAYANQDRAPRRLHYQGTATVCSDCGKS